MLRQKHRSSTLLLPTNILGEALQLECDLAGGAIASSIFKNKKLKPEQTVHEDAVFTLRRLLGCKSGKVNKARANKLISQVLGEDYSKRNQSILKLEEKTSCNAAALLQAIVAAGLALDNPATAIITDRKAFDIIQPLVGLDSTPENLYFSNTNNIFCWWDHHTTSLELLFAASLFEAAIPKQANGKKPFYVSYSGEHPRTYFEEDYLEVRPDGVYDERNRRVNNSLVVSNPNPCTPVVQSELSFLNSYGSVLYVLANSIKSMKANNNVWRVASVYRSLVNGVLAMDSEEESGGVADRGDRLFYNLYTTKALQTNGSLPFSFELVNGECKADFNPKAGVTSYSGFAAHLDEAAFELKLSRMHKGKMPFINASTTCIRIAFFPESVQDEILQQVVTKVTGKDTKAGLQQLFPELALLSEADLTRIAKRELVIGMSTKLSKLSKRIGLAAAKHAEPIGGEDRAFRFYGQHTGYAPGHTYNVAIAQRAIFTPGQSIQICDALAPVKIQQRQQVELEFYDLEAGVEVFLSQELTTNERGEVIADYTQEVTEYQGHKLQGAAFSCKEILVTVPYAGGMNFVQAEDDGILTQIVFSKSSFGNLVISIEYFIIDTIGKLRANVKTLPCKVPTGEEFIYNKLNENIPAGIDLVIPGDADKSKDLMISLLDVAAQTYIAQPDKAEGLVDLNSSIGVDDNKGLVFSPAAALTGHYDKLLSNFESAYGRSIWLYHRDCGDNQIAAVKELYLNRVSENKGGWHSLDIKLFPQFPETAIVLANGKITDAGADILVFYTEESADLPEVMWQRTFAFVGNNSGHVRLNVKFELSSVGQAVSDTNLMVSVARAVATGIGGAEGDRAGALALMSDVPVYVDRYVKLQRLLSGRPITLAGEAEALPVISLLTPAYQLTEEAKTLFASEEWAEIKAKADSPNFTLEQLSKTANRVVFSLPVVRGIGNSPHLHIPTLAAFDMSARSKQGLSGLVLTLIRWLLTGVSGERLRKRIDRIQGALTNLAMSEGLRKGLMQGRRSAQCKLLGVPGVPIDELWVQISDSRKSFYQRLVKAFKLRDISELNEQQVIVSRAPMPFPAMLKVRVITSDDWRAYACNVYQAAVSPLMCYTNGGDHDGDGYTVTPADDIKLPLLTGDILKQVLRDRTGVDALAAEQKAYIADHYNIKAYKALKLFSSDNVTMVRRSAPTLDPKNALAIERKGLLTMFVHATKMQQTTIGSGHELCYTAETAISIFADCKEVIAEVFPTDAASAFPDWQTDTTGVLPLYELYENPLGGLSWEAWDALTALLTAMYGDEAQELNVTDLMHNLSEGGMNGSRAQDFYSMALYVKVARTLARDAEKVKELADNSIQFFICVAAEISFLLGKADFDPSFGPTGPNAHMLMAMHYLGWERETRARLVKESIALQTVETYLQNVIPLFYSEVEETAVEAVNPEVPSVSVSEDTAEATAT
jgi:hypothetical protein